MTTSHRRLVSTLCVSLLLVAACGFANTASAPAAGPRPEPARLEPIAGTELSRVILTEEAAHRIDLQTEEAREAQIAGASRLVIPYAAVIYDIEGATWAYTSSEPMSFVRQSLTIETIVDDLAILSDGPSPGTQVVTVGAAELYGAEFEFKEG